MPAAYRIAPVLFLVLALGACGGGGDGEGENGGGDTSSNPPPPAAPPPAAPPPTSTPPPAEPPPVAENQAPLANAGEDKSTVEEQDVNVDGSGTSDPDGDALTFAWRIVSAPSGSGVAVDASTASFVFRPDLPGTYQLQLTVSDGKRSSSDTMQVTAEPLLVLEEGGTLKAEVKEGKRKSEIEGDRRLDLDLETSAQYRGEPVAFTVATNVPWLRPVRSTGSSAPAGGSTEVSVELVPSEVEQMSSGKHEARVTVTPSGGWEQAAATVTLELERKSRYEAESYVTYAGQPTRMTLYGAALLEAANQSVIIDGVEVPGLEVGSNERASVELPIPGDIQRLDIAAAGEVSTELAPAASSNEPIQALTELSLPDLVRSLEYDTERDAFYAVFIAADGGRTAFRLQSSADGNWTREPIPIEEPWAVALTANGAELIVSSDNCTVHKLDASTLAVLQALTKASCDPVNERFGAMAALADGRVLIVDDAGDSTVWEYPNFEPVEILPSRQSPFLVLNRERNRLSWYGDTADGSFSLDVLELDGAAPGQ